MPILMIQTDKTTVFLNLPEDGAIEELYEELKAKSGSGK
jgi:pyruvate/2-oxoglutarate dehydrogenase complex dihydrolipoamide acyltransferase (E2) component